jgi:hypothetical protein
MEYNKKYVQVLLIWQIPLMTHSTYSEGDLRKPDPKALLLDGEFWSELRLTTVNVRRQLCFKGRDQATGGCFNKRLSLLWPSSGVSAVAKAAGSTKRLQHCQRRRTMVAIE